ncbi:GAF domain-containing protein [Luteimonas aestuarii]|nr:GAF domain-containing protein [Luteimonas aestuarii]
MTKTPGPALDETKRQRALDGYHVLDSLPDAAYDDIVKLASTVCGTPTALLTLVDRDRQWFKARVGFDTPQTSRDIAVCDHAIRTPGQLLEIADLSQDERFAANPYVNGERGAARFYAGMPLVTPAGAAIGTVCVVDDSPRELADDQRASLEALARITMALLEAGARQRERAHEAFIADAVPAPIAKAAHAPTYLLALVELQDLAGTVARLGERATEKLLQALDIRLEQALPDGRGDAINRSSGSGEYVAVLHGEDAGMALDRLQAILAEASLVHGLRFLTGVAEGSAAEPTAAVFMRADADLLDRKASGHGH